MFEFICYDCPFHTVQRTWSLANEYSEEHIERTHHQTVEVR